jgi:hypothetical protein
MSKQPLLAKDSTKKAHPTKTPKKKKSSKVTKK